MSTTQSFWSQHAEFLLSNKAPPTSWDDKVWIINIWAFLDLFCWFPYDAVSDLMHNWVAQRPDFKSAVRVVKMVLNTQHYQYLWITMWFHAKKSKKTLKKSNSLILLCRFGSQAQKWPKFAKKTDHLTFLKNPPPISTSPPPSTTFVGNEIWSGKLTSPR